MPHHHLQASPESCLLGREASLKPVLTIASGDEITIDTISGGPDVVPDRSRFHVPPELAQVHAKSERMVPGHILTGPVAVEGAAPGDVLEVEILGYQTAPGLGLQSDPSASPAPCQTIFSEARLINIPGSGTHGRPATLGAGLPPKPFFGVMGVAPPPAWGRITSLIPAPWAVTFDNKELIPAPSSICRCSWRGRCSPCGDGHGVQGDGEVCVTAIETALQGRFKLTLRKDSGFTYPRRKP